MSGSADIPVSENTQSIPFKAETRQLLDILVHSLYTEREIFLRELISNASDALTRMDFEILTNRNVLNPDLDLNIRIIPDSDEKTLTIRDSGVGMTSEELSTNLGTIAHSGAKAFLNAAQEGDRRISDIIGQFGVGFYAAFMVAEWIKVVSRSYRPETEAGVWYSSGDDFYTVEKADREERGTEVIIKLKEDAYEFLEEQRLSEIVRKHSDFIPFPIFIGDSKEQANRQTAIWRQNPRQVEEKEYHEFYRQLTLDFEPPLTYTHMVVDAPVQMYAVLFLPSRQERGMFSLRRDEGLKLYARKVLIQEYSKDLLPEYLRFIDGVVDSEDLPLNVSRETVQSSKVMAQLKKLVTSKVIDMLKKLAEDKPDDYERLWKEFGRFIKQGVAMDITETESLYPLLRFRTTLQPDKWSSLDDYVSRMKPEQKDIYYIMGEDERSVHISPHLDLIRRYEYEALVLTDPMDAFMRMKLTEYKNHNLVNVASADLKLPEDAQKVEEEKEKEPAPAVPVDEYAGLVDRFKTRLGEHVAGVRMSDRLSGSPARLVEPEGGPTQELQRVYRLLHEDFEIPKKVLELNPSHPILLRLHNLPGDHAMNEVVIDQIFENALLLEGLHPDPVGMIPRLQKLIEAALD
jgi:molecular chaperone HtpG